MDFDINDLTIGEVEVIEEKTGLAIDKMADPSAPKGKLARAIAWIALRRENPEATWEEAGEVKISFLTKGDEASS